MWVAKFKVWHKDCKIRPLCKKYNITDFVYVVKSWEEQNSFYYIQYHILQGRDEDKGKFFRELKKTKGTQKADFYGNCIITLRKESLKESFNPIFNPKIIQVKPVIQRTDGFEDWELASWDRKELMRVFDISLYESKLLSIEKRKSADIVLSHIAPDLTRKQKEAVKLAISKGYYDFPRKIDLVHLGKLAGVSRPSFQERLRKAEKKIMPLFSENVD